MSFTENLSKVGEIVGRVAPLLGNAFINPVGSAIGIVGEVAKIFGANVNADPQSMLKLIEIQNQHRISLENIEVEKQKIAASDRDSARQRETAITVAGKKNYVQEILAIGVLLIYGISMLYSMYTLSTQDDVGASRIQDLMLIILAYYFGTSLSSRKKDELIAKHIK